MRLSHFAILLFSLIGISYSQLPQSPIKKVYFELKYQSTKIELIRRDEFQNHNDSLYGSGFELLGNFQDGNRKFWDSLFLSAEIVNDSNCLPFCGGYCPTAEITIIDANDDTSTVHFYECGEDVFDSFESKGITYCISFGLKFEIYKARIERAFIRLRELISED